MLFHFLSSKRSIEVNKYILQKMRKKMSKKKCLLSCKEKCKMKVKKMGNLN